MHHFFPLFLFIQILLVDAFDSHQLPGESVHPQIDFPEGSSAEHLASSVELVRGFWRLFVVDEPISDHV